MTPTPRICDSTIFTNHEKFSALRFSKLKMLGANLDFPGANRVIALHSVRGMEHKRGRYTRESIPRFLHNKPAFQLLQNSMQIMEGRFNITYIGLIV